jgi:hypothetical protein
MFAILLHGGWVTLIAASLFWLSHCGVFTGQMGNSAAALDALRFVIGENRRFH